MLEVKIYNLEGKVSGEKKLNEAVFGVKAKKSLIHQVFVALLANARQPWAHVKTKGEVRGGGRKPWKQKGTGRARHGSIRSPLWKGGGITFGPRNDRNYKQKINKKMNQIAVRMCLSDKLASDRLLVLENLPTDGKTKTFANLLKNLPCTKRSTLLLTAKNEKQTRLAVGNVPAVSVQIAKDANVVDLLNNEYLLVTWPAIEALEKRLAK